MDYENLFRQVASGHGTGYSWVAGILTILVAVFAGKMIIKQILPLVKEYLNKYIQDDYIADGLVKFTSILIVVAIVRGVLSGIAIIRNKALSYLSILSLPLEIVSNFLDKVQWLIYIGGLLLIGLVIFKAVSGASKE